MDAQQKPSWIELESIVPLKSYKGERDVAGITSLSDDSLRRHFPHLIKKLGARKYGMKLRDALSIANGQT